MFKALFNIMINALATLIQIIVSPINALIATTLPDLTDKIYWITNEINSLFDCITWALGIVPPIVITTLLFIILCEIAMHTIFKSTHMLLKVWNLFQKIKFW